MNKISEKDLTGVLINVLIVKPVMFYPRKIVNIAGNASWIASIYVCLIMLLIFFTISKIYDFLETIIKKSEHCGGKIFKIIIGSLIISMLITSMASMVRIYPESVKIIFLKHTPIEILMFMLAMAAVFGVWCGINSIGRIVSVFLPLAAIIMSVIFVLLIPHMEISNLTPILGPGVKTIFIKGLSAVSGFSDIIILFILGKGRNVKKCGYKSIIIASAVITIILFSYCMLVPYNISKYYLMPIYQMTRVIQIGEFFSRFEIFFEFIWTILVMLYFSAYLSAICKVWQEMFEIKYHKQLALPFMIIVICLALIPGSYLEFSDDYSWYTLFILFVSVGLPIVIGVFEKIRSRK